MTAVELSFWIRVYSARVLILTDNHKAAKKELKNALQVNNTNSFMASKPSTLNLPRYSTAITRLNPALPRILLRCTTFIRRRLSS